jgi:hypothetical protein
MLSCIGCGRRLRMEYTDEWCHACLEHLRTKLALQLLNGQHGMAHGPDLPTIFAQRVSWSGVARKSWTELLRDLD